MRRRMGRGISLIDIMVAFTVFSVAITCTLTIFPTSVKLIRQARLQSMASHLAQSALEDAANQTFAGLAATSTTSTTLSTTINGTQEYVTFTSTVTATAVSGSSTLKDVAVTVTWYDNDSSIGNTAKARRCTLGTVVADRS